MSFRLHFFIELFNQFSEQPFFFSLVWTRRTLSHSVYLLFRIFLDKIVQQPPSTLMALRFTSASEIFFRAAARILETVERWTFIRKAVACWSSFRRSQSRRASNSSRERVTPWSFPLGRHRGRKQRSPGWHLIHLVFLGLMPVSHYAHMCIIPGEGSSCQAFAAKHVFAMFWLGCGGELC